MPVPQRDGENLYAIIDKKISREEFEREIKKLNDDVRNLKDDFKNGFKEMQTSMNQLKETIIENQKANYRRIIYVQSTILIVILGTVITLLVKVLFKV